MKSIIPKLKKSQLFDRMNDEEIEHCLKCSKSSIVSYKKDEIIFFEEDTPKKLFILIEGSVSICNDSLSGKRNIITTINHEGDLFGETYALSDTDRLPISVIAMQDCEVILIDCKKIIKTCSNSCSFHAKLIDNIIKILANKNIALNQKIHHIVKRTTREKLISYLSEQAERVKSNVFKIPFNRQELADYLSVERSAMSNELCKLRDEGIIEFNKNEFRLK